MPVYDRGWLTDDRPYFVMELLYQPITLTELVEQIHMGTIGANHPRLRAWTDLRRCLADVVLPICEGVHVANAEYGIQHRDLKPDNVLIDIRTRRAYLIDFGICRDMNDRRDAGKIVGTPRFLAPEQAAGKVDPRTDVWGLGALIRFVVTGEPPIEATSPFTRQEVRDRIEALKTAEEKARAAGEDARARGYAGRRAQLEDPELRVQDDLIRDATAGRYLPLPESTSPGLLALIKKAMAPESEDRYDTAGDLARDLRTWIKGGSVLALSEAGRRGAVFDWTRRHLNRNVMRVVGALVAVLLGVVIGLALFGRSIPRPDHRFEDAAADMERLAVDYARVQARASQAEGRMGPLGCAVAYRATADGYAPLRALVDAASAETLDPKLRGDLRTGTERLAARLAKPTVSLRGRAGDGWHIRDLFAATTKVLPAKAGAVSTPPGLYVLAGGPADGLAIRMALPGAAGVPPRVLEVGGQPRSVPQGMTWVPAGAVPLRDETLYREVAAFLASTDLVTNERYSEWLDDLTPAERNASVPPTGFTRDARSDRWLVAPDMSNQPVLGVSPRDAAAYAAWRSDMEGVAYVLPHEHHWLRMAAIDQLGTPGDHLLFAARGALPWQARRRGGEQVPTPTYLREFRGASPYGVRQIYVPPGEIVRGEGEDAFLVKGAGGMLPYRCALRRSGAVDLDDKGHAHGFRLIHVPR
jgi:hypothetical protein